MFARSVTLSARCLPLRGAMAAPRCGPKVAVVCLSLPVRHVATTQKGTRGARQQPADEGIDFGERVMALDGQERAVRWKRVTPSALASYTDLSKARLASLVVLTTMCGYALAPPIGHVSALAWTTLGTALCVSSANSINQWVEFPFDAQMARTRNRVLVRHLLSPTHAFTFGTVAGIVGVGVLYHFVNPITALLGGLNIILYTAVYTPLKRTSIANTWVGAVVGAIPPMMGWTAVTGTIDPGALLLGGILYAWQFPHFNSLSWNLRADYSKAGYRMMSVIDPKLTTRVSLRYSLALFPITWGCTWVGLTDAYFLVDSGIANAVLTGLAVEFWRKPGEKTARRLFFASLLHLPILLALMIAHKKGPE
ncbi:UbiA prenyltransferase family-domain-containing protein [Hyaloraphidium curvatum]|nr:UbiA prenyltransferase family-domain-containing protein [Hyaloraphidium curvatum]